VLNGPLCIYVHAEATVWQTSESSKSPRPAVAACGGACGAALRRPRTAGGRPGVGRAYGRARPPSAPPWRRARFHAPGSGRCSRRGGSGSTLGGRTCQQGPSAPHSGPLQNIPCQYRQHKGLVWGSIPVGGDSSTTHSSYSKFAARVFFSPCSLGANFEIFLQHEVPRQLLAAESQVSNLYMIFGTLV